MPAPPSAPQGGRAQVGTSHQDFAHTAEAQHASAGLSSTNDRDSPQNGQLTGFPPERVELRA